LRVFLEYWSIGVLARAKSEFQIELIFFNTPLLHHSITPADCRKRGKTIEAPSGGGPKPGPLGADYLFPPIDKSDNLGFH